MNYMNADMLYWKHVNTLLLSTAKVVYAVSCGEAVTRRSWGLTLTRGVCMLSFMGFEHEITFKMCGIRRAVRDSLR